MSELTVLRMFCKAHDLPWTDEAAERIATYLDLLIQFNKKINLIGPFRRPQVIRQLIIDSITPAVMCPPADSVLDIGSGAGFPGLPLAAFYPDVPMTLVEPRQKRANFLRIAKNRMKLNHIQVIEARVEDVDIEPHDWLVSKAFRAPPVWLDVALPLLADGGKIICMHAANTTTELRSHGAELGLREVAHVADVAAVYNTEVPAGHALSLYERNP